MIVSSDLFIQMVAAFLFTIGLCIVTLRRNSMMILMGIELMLNSANLALVGFSRGFGMVEGQIQVFFIITIAAAESAIGLSILINLYRNFGSIKTSQTVLLKG